VDETNWRTIPLCGPGLIGRRLEIRSEGVARRRLPVTEGLVLNIAAHELRGTRGAVHLRPREFQLLATLAARPGHALTRRELVDLAWGPGALVGPRTVDVHVHWLRSKIEPVPARPTHLVAVRGFGYRLDPVSR
jgi:DNA-binding response OmpR family regulator